MATRPEGSFNRRKYPRLKIEAHAILYLDKNIKKGFKLIDISPRGVGGLIDCPLKVGDKVEILLLYPFFDDPVKKEAKVVRCKEINQNTWAAGFDFGEDNKIDLTNYFKLK
jgi:hypothetical protein